MQKYLLCTVMLTALLKPPSLDSHQYTAGLAVAFFTVQVDPRIVPQTEQFASVPASLSLITLHSEGFPSQRSETDSSEKCCTLSGVTLTVAVAELES